MSIDKYEDKFLNNFETNEYLDINFNPINELGLSKIPYGSIIELRANDLSGQLFPINVFINNDVYGLFIDIDKTIDYLYLNSEQYSSCTEINFDNIKNLSDINCRIIIINSIFGLLPIDKNYNKLNKTLENLFKENKDKIFIFLNPYLDNKYDIISKYANIILLFNKRTSIVKNNKKIGYNVDCEILRNTINLKTSKSQFRFFYSEGIK
jgi:hypothetical protein